MPLYRELGNISKDLNNLESAMHHYENALFCSLGENVMNYDLEDLYVNMAEVMLEEGSKRGIECLRKALDVSSNLRGPNSIVLGWIQNKLGDALVEAGNKP